MVQGEKTSETGLKRSLSRRLVGLYAALAGLLFFLMQTSKLIWREAAEAEMATLPCGRFDWGYVWSDTLVAGPFLLIGGILLLSRNPAACRMGRLLVFAGFALNLYAMIFFWVGLQALGRPMSKGEVWFNLFFTVFGMITMIYLSVESLREGESA